MPRVKSKVEIDDSYTPKTNKEKAEYIIKMGFSDKSQSTLERKTAEELDWIIENEREPLEEEFSVDNAKALKELIGQLLEFADTYKLEQQEKGINKALKAFILLNCQKINFVNAKISGLAGLIAVFCALLFVLVDAFLGFAKVKNLFKKKSNAETQSKQYY